jgi:hypothetical protein
MSRIGAEQEPAAAADLPGGRHQRRVAILFDRRIRRNHIGQQRHRNHGGHDHEADDGAAILPEIVPELTQRMRRCARHGDSDDLVHAL